VEDLPVFGMGHSLGALTHLLIGEVVSHSADFHTIIFQLKYYYVEGQEGRVNYWTSTVNFF